MANATEVARARSRIVDTYPLSHLGTTGEERALAAADTGVGYESGGGFGEFSVSQDLLAASVDCWAYVAREPCRVLGFSEVHSVVGSTSAAVRPRKVTGVAAPGAAASATVVELSASIDLTAAVNTVVTPALVTTEGVPLLAAGDKIGLDFSGTLTGLVGTLTIHLQKL